MKKIDLTICGVHELPEHEGKPWTHVISIWDKEYMDDVACREQVKDVAPGAKLLFCFFEDMFSNADTASLLSERR